MTLVRYLHFLLITTAFITNSFMKIYNEKKGMYLSLLKTNWRSNFS